MCKGLLIMFQVEQLKVTKKTNFKTFPKDIFEFYLKNLFCNIRHGNKSFN